MSRSYSKRGDSCNTVLLGYPLEVTDRGVTVRDKQGRKLATVASMSAARRFLKGYRRDPSLVTAEPVRLSREGDGLAPTQETVHA